MDVEEKLLLTVFVGLSVAMFAGSFEYSTVEATMPRAASALVVLFGVAVLVREHADALPAGGDGGLADVADDGSTEADHGVDPFDHGGDSKTIRFRGATIPFRAVVAALLTAYVLAGFLIGLFWSSLAFVLLYSWLVGLSRWKTAGLLVVTFLTLYVFGAFLDVPVTEAYLLTVAVGT